jgi:hypothetical protein
VLNNVGGKIEASNFKTLIRPPCCIPWHITELTGIGDNDVMGIETIHNVGIFFNPYHGTNKIV